MDNVENIPKAMVDGLRSLDPNELTVEEAAALDYADEQEQIQQNNRDAIDEILDAIQGMPNAPDRHEIEAQEHRSDRDPAQLQGDEAAKHHVDQGVGAQNTMRRNPLQNG